MRLLLFMGSMMMMINGAAQQAFTSFAPVQKMTFTPHRIFEANYKKDVLLKSELQYNYYDNLGAACKAEYQIEKAVKVPLRIRVGSIESCNYLEGKPNAAHP